VSQQGIALGRHLRPRAAWYGKMKLTEHIGAIVRSGAIDVSVTWGEPIPYDGAADRKALARQLESSIRQNTVSALRGSSTAASAAG
jgi:1-acyl-sn-glycerol-3-phosphate acyltransferase